MTEITPLPASSPDPCGPILSRRMRLPITWVLMLGFGGLMLAAVASVFWLGVLTSGRNTYSLLLDKAELAMAVAESRVRAQLDPAALQVNKLTDLLARGVVDWEDDPRLEDLMQGAISTTPQIGGMAFLRPDHYPLAVAQDGPASVAQSMRDMTEAPQIIMETMGTKDAHWIDPVWADGLGATVMVVKAPVRKEGQFLGVMISAVSFTGLSRFLGDMARDSDLNAFILFDDQYVLAHPAMAGRKFDFSDTKKDRPPLPTMTELGDQIAAGIWQRVGPDGLGTGKGDTTAGKKTDTTLVWSGRRTDIDFREAVVNGQEYYYLLKSIPDYGEHPFTLVVAMRGEDVDQEISRFMHLLIVGFGILVVSVLLALALGKMMSRRIRRLAKTAVALRDLDFHNVPRLPDSRFRELADAAAAFNTMISGLRWFENYVPKSLVLRLIQRDGEQGGVISEEREVTVMFTDIKGFSALAETMPPQEIADWLNRHFTRIAACIEAEGGTVDKFIGDAVMAFWGAPEDQPDHAARALRAAHAIARVVAEEGDEARALGRLPVCLRVGVHTGPVIVGNIGAVSRINYTIVGDTVNTAARLEALGSDMMGDECYVVLASGETVAAAGGCTVDMPLTAIGTYSLRGRTGLVDVWRLVVDID
ncbi:adenylate/guanylate cyclase domain-containing protein [Niveispirillum irakense]|uniref:adenylate/guanylate cyclase domain-containing protein n=1 Tax=Niveispirillum irakense TaxID=34011 RepID=UPI000A05AAD0|nr:adenylate/guanylate cyclase domain-containing protein [Niveispirillum irakense]